MDNIYKVKICGLTKQSDVILASNLGAWALGFIFYEKSPRVVSATHSRDLINSIEASELKPKHLIGVFVNAPIETIVETCRVSGINTVQLHGDEDPGFIQKLKKQTNAKIIKVFRPTNEQDLNGIEDYCEADFFLCDAAVQGSYGGTGQLGNWDLIRRFNAFRPSILAGGIGPDNIVQAFNQAHPFACDLSSSIEISPGIKNHNKMKSLFKALAK